MLNRELKYLKLTPIGPKLSLNRAHQHARDEERAQPPQPASYSDAKSRES
jgi:hypothetical protein